MKVTLIDYTGAGRCVNPGDGRSCDDDNIWWGAYLLIYTKSTRLRMHPGLLDEIRQWPISKITEELEYMANTIPSSWEFVDYTFQIEGVTRAFTHQFVRTRTASFAQQTMRVLNVSEGRGWDYLTGPSIVAKDIHDDSREIVYDDVMRMIAQGYITLLERGAKPEDARGILPTNILTNITCKMNMRTFVELVHKRESSRTQGEYRDVLAAMKAEVLRAHPWASIFLDQTASKAVNDLEEMINNLGKLRDDVGYVSKDERTKMIKLLDQIRRAL